MADALGPAIAAALRSARASRGLSVAGLAEASGVSRAMIAKIERAEAQPTAVLLARLASALGLTLSQLVARAEGGDGRLSRRADQPTWSDPQTGYVRRAVSPPSGTGLELVEVVLPPGARAAFPRESYAFVTHQIWVLEGRLRFEEGDQVHDLLPGDCLELGAPAPCAYVNPADLPCRYLVALARNAVP